MAERPFQPVPNTPLVADPTGDAIWKRWLQGLQSFLGSAVRGPGSSTDNAVARWDGTSGTFLNNSGVIIDDSNNVSGIVNLTTTGNTILGDASADTITFNAGILDLNNDIRIRRADHVAASGIVSLVDFENDATGDPSGSSNIRGVLSVLELHGANNISNATASYSLCQNIGTGTITTQYGNLFSSGLTASGNITTAIGTQGSVFISGSGNITTGYGFFAQSPVFSSTGVITTLIGFGVNNLGNAKVTTAIGVKIDDFTASTTMTGIQSELSAGTGKKNLNITGTADNSLAGPLYLAQDNKTQQTASAMYAGTGAPNNANGSDGDFYLRGNGTVAGSNIVYHKEAGAWVALTGGGGGGASGTTVEVDLGTPKFTGKFTITDAAISATSKVQCWQAPGPYTGKGTLADEAMMQPVQIIAVAPAAGSAVVYWQTPPYVAMSQQLSNGKFGAAGATFDRLMNQRTPAVFTPTRIGKVRGNVKFTYTILT